MSNDLKALLVQLQNDEIEAVEFGEPGKPMGFMSSHRILFMTTTGGTQFALKQVTSRGLGSGLYLGLDVEAVIEASTKQAEHYMRPHPNALIRKFIAQKGDRTKLEYFAVPKSA